jgi:DNA-binding beta-propeller fold protein YncE
MDRSISRLHRWFVALGFGVASVMSIAPAQATLCGGVAYPFPYMDVSGVGAPFCPGIMEAYVTGVSKGTTGTTFSPNDNVSRLQMTTFLQRSLDQGLTRANRRAALNRWSIPKFPGLMQTIAVGGSPFACAADGEDIWTSTNGQVIQVPANTGKVLGTWTGAIASSGVLAAAGKVFVTGDTSPGSLYVIDPTQPPGTVTVAASNLGNRPFSIATDGTYIWTADNGPPGSVSFIFPPSYIVAIQTAGFNAPTGILYDGANIWVTDHGAGTLLKLDPNNGGILKTVIVGSAPFYPVFDGENIWVPNNGDDSVTVVQASSATVVATIVSDASNQLNGPLAASFDGEHILVTNANGNTVTVFKAADLSFIANVSTGPSSTPASACSDGTNFWVPLRNTTNLLRI